MYPPPLVSIIIPTYKVENYIARCLNSCLLQSFENIEVLVIDDCGGDNSIKIAQEFAEKDPRVKIFYNPENLGSFHSRLRGMREVRGDYVLFLDSDDYIALNTCEVVVNAFLGEEKLDILVFNIEGCEWDPVIDQVPSTKKEAIKKFYGASICARAYSKEIIQKTLQAFDNYFPFLPRLNIHEDMVISLALSYFCKSYMIVTDVLYFYCENPASITRRQDRKGEYEIERMHEIDRMRVKRLLGYFDSLPFKDLDFDYFRGHSIESLEALLKSHKRKRIINFFSRKKGFFSYPKGVYLSNRYIPSLRNYVNMAFYFLSFGKIKRL